MIPTWSSRVNVLAAKDGIHVIGAVSSHRRDRPRVVIEKRAPSQPAPAAAGGTRCGTVTFSGSVADVADEGCFRHQLLLRPAPYLVSNQTA